MKIFVADDSAMLREQIIALLSGLDGVVISGQAHDARVAYQSICALKPDVVILDIQMIGGSGIDVLKQIKQELRAPVVMMLTNRTSPPYRKRCQQAGADYFLDKSTELGKVKEIIQGLLARFDATGSVAPLDWG